MEENGGAQAQEGVADMKTRISVQERLKDLRVEKGLKLEELAEQVGLSKSALGSYEITDEKNENKEINHGSLLKLADFYQVSVDYLLGLTDNRNYLDTPLAELHLTDEAVALLKSGRVNNRLLCEMMAHKDFVRLLADIEIYVDRVASMQVQSLNAYVDVVRQEIIDRYQPGEDDPHLRVLRAAHLDEDEYFSQLVSEDLRRVIQDIRAAHKGDSESAPVNTVAEELRRDIEETMNFKGSDLERQAMLYYKRLGINYSKLTETEFRQLIHILDKSSLLKTHGSKRKMRK